MKKFIEHELNTKLVINNTLAGSLGNFILLIGPFGTGKTEFAKEIGKMITCENPSTDGYCGVCPKCIANEDINGTMFDKPVSLINVGTMPIKDFREHVQSAHKLLSEDKRVIILDEFQKQEKSVQEELLSDFPYFKNAYLIFTTTRKRDIEEGIINRSTTIKTKNLSLNGAKELLDLNHMKGLSTSVVTNIHKRSKGSPRLMLANARLVINGQLNEAEALEYISDQNIDFSFVDLFRNFHDRPYIINKCLEAKKHLSKSDIDDLALDMLSEINNGKLKDITEHFSKEIIFELLFSDGDKLMRFIQVLDRHSDKSADEKVVKTLSAEASTIKMMENDKSPNSPKTKIESTIKEWR